MDLCRDRPAYYATAKELAGWLVQLATELSSEVGSNVPAEFIAPIRPSEGDYRLGLIVNPETLRTGKPVSLKHYELNEGLIVCGGENRDRHEVLVRLVTRLIESGKRVLIITSRREVLELAGFSDPDVTSCARPNFTRLG